MAQNDIGKHRRVIVEKAWVPNRKVLAGAIAGLLSLGAFVLTGADLDPAVSASLTAAVVTLVSYFVPLGSE